MLKANNQTAVDARILFDLITVLANSDSKEVLADIADLASEAERHNIESATALNEAKAIRDEITERSASLETQGATARADIDLANRKKQELAAREQAFEAASIAREQFLNEREAELNHHDVALINRESELTARSAGLDVRSTELDQREADIKARMDRLQAAIGG
jgi:hypothetical protein